jgi:predicted short-subunit dehydrogenase-like oxidoreductase (DUF2520 family)
VKIGIIGAGKVGTAIGSAMQKKGLRICAMSDVRQESLDTAERYLGKECVYTHDNCEVVRTSDVVAITTQDREIRRVAREIFEGPVEIRSKLFFHTSGAHPSSILSPLEEKGAILGSLHPLQTFPDIDSAVEVLPSTYVFIEGDERGLGTLELLGSIIGLKAVAMEGDQKVLYHLSAVFVCNLLCALLYSAEGIMERINIELEPFYPIIKATLRNIELKGPLMSLTGPVIRGDVETVAEHQRAMSDLPAQKGLYKALYLVALDMSRKRGVLDEETLNALQVALDKDEG